VTISAAIDEFRAAANTKADGARPVSLDHALHARMSRAYHYLVSLGEGGRAAFSALLHDESPCVRAWVAAQLLSEGERAAIPIMQQLAASPGIRGFNAEMTLSEFQAGNLRSPFSTDDT
jgi:hypothetical protein